jgi:hypothetical protein
MQSLYSILLKYKSKPKLDEGQVARYSMSNIPIIYRVNVLQSIAKFGKHNFDFPS